MRNSAKDTLRIWLARANSSWRFEWDGEVLTLRYKDGETTLLSSMTVKDAQVHLRSGRDVPLAVLMEWLGVLYALRKETLLLGEVSAAFEYLTSTRMLSSPPT